MKNLRAQAITVVGDIMVDEYVKGQVNRISPEAPIPILKFEEKKRTPGGAANVAMNLRTLGGEVALFGIVGDDEPGHWVVECLKICGINTNGIIVDKSRPTTLKTRYSTEQQAIVRIDQENTHLIDSSIIRILSNKLSEHVRMSPQDGLLVSDYGKGCLKGSTSSNELLQLLSHQATKAKISAVDTKSLCDARYSGFTFIKPNLQELEVFYGKEINDQMTLRNAAHDYLTCSGCNSVLVTLGPRGMYYYSEYGEEILPAIPARVHDVTGAGDTVLAVTAFALCSDYEWPNAIRLANISAAIAIEHKGTKSVSLKELSERIENIRNEEPAYIRTF